VSLADGTAYDIRSPVEGSIIELNEELYNSVEVLRLHPESRGFVAFINPWGK
jgi:glycine cleavage system H lipoate-binding protein